MNFSNKLWPKIQANFSLRFEQTSVSDAGKLEPQIQTNFSLRFRQTSASDSGKLQPQIQANFSFQIPNNIIHHFHSNHIHLPQESPSARQYQSIPKPENRSRTSALSISTRKNKPYDLDNLQSCQANPPFGKHFLLRFKLLPHRDELRHIPLPIVVVAL
jgi:hypothetical protein